MCQVVTLEEGVRVLNVVVLVEAEGEAMKGEGALISRGKIVCCKVIVPQTQVAQF